MRGQSVQGKLLKLLRVDVLIQMSREGLYRLPNSEVMRSEVVFLVRLWTNKVGLG